MRVNRKYLLPHIFVTKLRASRSKSPLRRYLFTLAAQIPAARRTQAMRLDMSRRYHTKERAAAASQNLTGLTPVQPFLHRYLPNLPASREPRSFSTCRTGTERVSLFSSGRLSCRTLRICASAWIMVSQSQ